jgi:hypothetical protein
MGLICSRVSKKDKKSVVPIGQYSIVLSVEQWRALLITCPNLPPCRVPTGYLVDLSGKRSGEIANLLVGNETIGELVAMRSPLDADLLCKLVDGGWQPWEAQLGERQSPLERIAEHVRLVHGMGVVKRLLQRLLQHAPNQHATVEIDAFRLQLCEHNKLD